MDFESLKTHWPWLSPVFAALVGWLGRRKGIHPIRALVRQLELRKELASCQNSLARSEEAVTSERQAKEWALVALREITAAAAAAVKAENDEGRLTKSEPSSSSRSITPASSERSPSKPEGPLTIP